MTSGLWAKISVDYAEDPKIVRAGAMAEVLFIRSVCWCKKQNTATIPDVLLDRIGFGLDNVCELAERLVHVGLWEPCDQGWNIIKFEQWQTVTRNSSEKASFANHQRWHKKKSNPDCAWCLSQSSHNDPSGISQTDPTMIRMGYPREEQSREEQSRKDLLPVASADAQKLCDLLAQKMIVNGCKAPNVTRRWIDDMDKLMRIDGHTPEEIEQVIIWCQTDSFWCSNILSPAKLRAKFDALKLRMPKPEPEPVHVVRDPDFKYFEDGLVDAKIGLDEGSDLVQDRLAGMNDHQKTLYLQGLHGS